jgi:hypothetical protein
MPDRRFTSPWDIEDNGACFIVRDNNGQALSYGAPLPDYSRATKRGASPSISPNCRSW